ncbi:MAG: hypothetical protein PHW76_00340 [Alphaproteobacteria bacterium]|nr:hypothetical protein [Alphaproteobacteria bacterium]
MAYNYRGLSSCLSLILAAGIVAPAAAQNGTLRVLRFAINAESQNPQLCLEFDKPLAQASPSRLAATLRLEEYGKPVSAPNIAAANSSLCLFPLERNTPYRLTVKGLRGASDEKMAAPYTASFSIPNRAPLLAFTGDNGGVDELGSWDKPLTLRAVNVPEASIEVYRMTDPALMARVWQDRALTALAPSEAATLARSKGSPVWRENKTFAKATNETIEQKLSLKDRVPELPPGLYLIVADSGNNDKKNDKDKGLSPMAAAWAARSDIAVRMVRDTEGIHILASGPDGPRAGVHFSVFNGEATLMAEADSRGDGTAFIGNDPKLSEKGAIQTVVAADKAGHVAFADIEALPSLSADTYPDALRIDPLFVAPAEALDVFLSSTPLEKEPGLKNSTVLRLARNDFAYPNIPVPASAFDAGKMTIQTPPSPGEWSLLWQKADGAVLSETPLRVTSNPRGARLEISSERDTLLPDRNLTLSISSVSSDGTPAPFAGGRVLLTWEKLESSALGWKNYHFGTQASVSQKPVSVAAFLTDQNGQASLRLTLPPPPPEPGLYQASLKIVGDPDSGITDAQSLVLPLHPERTVIGIKPLVQNARFPQNGIARFSLIGLSSGGKPKDVSNLSFQIYEEGRSFAWYQHEGRWEYQPEAQLRPIGADAVTIKADGNTVVDWPVTAGNYRLEVSDPDGKVLARIPFSAGADSRGTVTTAPLAMILPKTISVGREAVTHVSLPEKAMLTAIVADTRIRKIVQKIGIKGENSISFTPSPDWAKNVTISVRAQSWNEGGAGQTRAAVAQASIARGETNASKTTGSASIVPSYNPSAIVLRKNDATMLTFAFQNNAPTSETYKYTFSASPGLMLSGTEGEVSLAPKQSKAVTLSLSGAVAGEKELRLEVSGGHAPRAIRNWPMAVLPELAYVGTAETATIAGRQELFSASKTREGRVAFISRLPMKGLPEILSHVFNAEPFTTKELALTLDALRLWRDTIGQAGIAPDFTVDAIERVYLKRLLNRQNPDGGFAPRRGVESTMSDTAAALSALGARSSKTDDPAKTLAIGWIKQRLSNTWFDESELPDRAAAHAALAEANAVDPASLHYFSDTSAAKKLPPVAEAQVAAAFKRIGDPNAAAFWIKKMLDENGRLKTTSMLYALSFTDALPSDDVVAATEAMGKDLRNGTAVELKDAAALLKAIASNNSLAGKIRTAAGQDTRVATGVVAMVPAKDKGFRNNSAEPLYATFIDAHPNSFSQGTTITRHIYRLNGVELSPTAKPLRGEPYLVEIKGEAPALPKGASALVQSRSNSLHPIGCPLSTQLGNLSFIPWLSARDLTPFTDCEFSPYGMNVVMQPTAGGKSSFSIAFFAHIDAPSSEIPAPTLRVLK